MFPSVLLMIFMERLVLNNWKKIHSEKEEIFVQKCGFLLINSIQEEIWFTVLGEGRYVSIVKEQVSRQELNILVQFVQDQVRWFVRSM